ncbi:MAG: hypothetical protein LBB98_14875, partial [Treponema sp.]|nr:hypothetical protein [Treponema sp.]
MKKKTEKISIYRTVISAALVVAAILSMAACAPVTGPEASPPPAGKGIVNIQLGVNEPGPARTLIPGSVAADAFDAYNLSFTVTADGGSGTAQSFSNVTSLTAALDAGKYDLVLTAKKSGTTAAEGSYKNITVTNGGTASVSVPLVFKAGAGDGTLKFTVTR